MKQAIAPRRSLFEALLQRSRISRRADRLTRKVRQHKFRQIDNRAGRVITNWMARRRRRATLDRWLRDYKRAVWWACSLAVYERLFALWHILHLPLFLLLILAIIVHVIAVHLY